MASLEFFFDCSSPWTYLAFERIRIIVLETGATVQWRPILVGGVFNQVNQGLYEERGRMARALAGDGDEGARRKAIYYQKDLADWARLAGVGIGQPGVFPVNSVRAMRACFYAEKHDCLVAWARAVFEAYWGRLLDISQPEVLSQVAVEVGLDPSELLSEIETPHFKERLKANTAELVERGGFGSPTMFVDGEDMYFGNDRLELVRASLSLSRGE